MGLISRQKYRVVSMEKGRRFLLWLGMALIIGIVIVKRVVYWDHVYNMYGWYFDRFPNKMAQFYCETPHPLPFILFGLCSCILLYVCSTSPQDDKYSHYTMWRALIPAMVVCVSSFFIFWFSCWFSDWMNFSDGMWADHYEGESYTNWLSIIIGGVMALANFIITWVVTVLGHKLKVK